MEKLPRSVALLIWGLISTLGWTADDALTQNTCELLTTEQIYTLQVGNELKASELTKHLQRHALPWRESQHKLLRIEFLDGTHELEKSIVLNAELSPPCGIELSAQNAGKAKIVPRRTQLIFRPFRSNIVQATIPEKRTVNGLTWDEEILPVSSFPNPNTPIPADVVHSLQLKNNSFRVKNGKTTQAIKRAFENSHHRKLGDPRIKIVGEGSIYSFRIRSIEVVSQNRNLSDIRLASEEKEATQVALKCMQPKAQKILSDAERLQCRADAAKVSDKRKQVWRPVKRGHAFFAENHLEFIDSPGEWAADKRTRKIFLQMPQNTTLEQLNRVGVFASFSSDSLHSLISIDNVPKVTIDSLSFSETHASLSFNNFAMARGAVSTGHLVWSSEDRNFIKRMLPAAVDVEGVEDLTVRRNHFSATHALALTAKVTQKGTFESNLFNQTGFSALEIRRSNSNPSLILRNNIFQNIGKYGVGEGIRILGIANATISNNDILNSSRGGIQIAAGKCGEVESFSNGVCKLHIRKNVIRNFANGPLSDYGGIYVNQTSFERPELVDGAWPTLMTIRDNYLENGMPPGFLVREKITGGPTGIYLDIGSKGVSIENNQIQRVYNAFNQNCSDFNIWKNNQTNEVVHQRKHQVKWPEIQRWKSKCIFMRPEWASIHPNSSLYFNNNTSVSLPLSVGLEKEERQYWEERGIKNIFQLGEGL
jgi:hypothetical protein